MVEAGEAEVEAGSIAELREKALQEGELMPRSNLKEWQKDYHQGNLFIMKQHLMEAPPIKLMSKLPKDPFAGGYKARHDGMEDTAYLKSLCHMHEGEVVKSCR